jgi:outer membrane protein assembly factor BamB
MLRSVFSSLITIVLFASAHAEQSVLTYHNDTFRTGWNAGETILTPGLIRSGSFGLIASVPLDDQVDAQPLVVNGLTLEGKQHDVVYVVTEANTVYAIDAQTGSTLIKPRSLGDPVPKSFIGCGNNGDNIGIASTPVIDLDNNTLYVIAFTLDAGHPLYRIHELDLTSLEDKVPSRSVSAVASLVDGSKMTFKPEVSRQRAALLFSKGRVYAAFGSFCDHKADQTRGWLMGWEAGSLEPLSDNQLIDRRNNTTDKFYLSSIWMSGYGPAADEDGSIYFITGNSRPSVTTIDPGINLPESVIKVKQELTRVHDFFTPSDKEFGQPSLDKRDIDFGSGGVLVIPGTQSGRVKHLAVAAGKPGKMYLLNRDDLGKFDPGGINRVLDTKDIGGCWCGQSYFRGSDGIGRIVSSGDPNLLVWRIDHTSSSTSLVLDYKATPDFSSDVFQKGFFTSVSSDGEKMNTGIIWAVERAKSKAPSSKVKKLTLHAIDAANGSELCSANAGPWVNLGGAPNTVPVVSNGRVFVASFKELRVFGVGGQPVCDMQAIASTDVPATTETEERKIDDGVSIVSGVAEFIEGTKFRLRTESKLITVDISNALKEGMVSNVQLGRGLVVEGAFDSNGVLIAKSVYYGGSQH